MFLQCDKEYEMLVGIVNTKLHVVGLVSTSCDKTNYPGIYVEHTILNCFAMYVNIIVSGNEILRNHRNMCLTMLKCCVFYLSS